jgi:hypothetical protein
LKDLSISNHRGGKKYYQEALKEKYLKEDKSEEQIETKKN